MKIKYIYSDEVNHSLSVIDDAICLRREIIRNELMNELSFHHEMFHKFFREDCANDSIIKQLRDKKVHIIHNALPIEILLED
jgi:hypothetical protein